MPPAISSTKRPTRLLVVTHRFAADIPGGAERHLYELVRRLHTDHGMTCEVWTTTGRDIEPVTRWGAMLHPGYPAGEESAPEGFRIRRFPLINWHRAIVALAGKRIQGAWEREEGRLNSNEFLPFGGPRDTTNTAAGLPPFLVGPGWHLPEPQPDGSLLRWTMPRAWVLRRGGEPGGRFVLSGFTPRKTMITFSQDKETLRQLAVDKGWFSVEAPLPPAAAGGSVLSIESEHGMRPLRDHRSLGLMISQFTFTPVRRVPAPGAAQGDAPLLIFDEAATISLPPREDYRSLLRRRWTTLLTHFTRRAANREPGWGRYFDFVRGPRSPRLWRALEDDALRSRFDAVLAANLPWNVIPNVARHCHLPMIAMPLWHLDDEFYFWQHYIDALKQARCVLSNTEWAAREVWPTFGIKTAAWAGPGVDESWNGKPAGGARDDWRRAHDIAPDAQVILSVARKSPSKRYDLLVDAMAAVRAKFPGAVLVLIGPDEDKRPIATEGVKYIGAANDAALHDAYLASDVFAMMSESESFGMVFVEAWLRRLPVIGNRWCAPVASLIEDGSDGLLAGNVDEVAGAIVRLLSDEFLRGRFGEAGRRKTLRDHTWKACAERVAGAIQKALAPA